MRLVGLPAALPQIMAGVRLSIAVSLLLLTVVSELILPTDGLGTYWVGAQARIDVAAVIAGLLVVSAVAVAVNALVLALVSRLLDGHVRRTALEEVGR